MHQVTYYMASLAASMFLSAQPGVARVNADLLGGHEFTCEDEGLPHC